MEDHTAPADRPRPRRAHRLSVWAGIAIGLLSALLGTVILIGGLMANLTVLNEAAFWFAVAAFAFGLTANATRRADTA
jgi:hypothetical protein